MAILAPFGDFGAKIGMGSKNFSLVRVEFTFWGSSRVESEVASSSRV